MSDLFVRAQIFAQNTKQSWDRFFEKNEMSSLNTQERKTTKQQLENQAVELAQQESAQSYKREKFKYTEFKHSTEQLNVPSYGELFEKEKEDHQLPTYEETQSPPKYETIYPNTDASEFSPQEQKILQQTEDIAGAASRREYNPQARTSNFGSASLFSEKEHNSINKGQNPHSFLKEILDKATAAIQSSNDALASGTVNHGAGAAEKTTTTEQTQPIAAERMV